MPRVTHVKRAQQRYETVPVLDEDGNQKVVPVMRRNGEQKVTKRGKPVTMKVTVSDKTRPLPPLTCEKCREPIEVGTPYKWVKPKTGPYGGRQRNRHAGCPNWRPSELTGSAALSTLYAAQEQAEDDLAAWSADDGVEALGSIIEALAEGVRETANVYEESGQNIEDGFGHETSMSEELREKAEALNSMADEIEGEGDFDDFDEDAATQEAEEETDDVDEDEIRAQVEEDHEADDLTEEDLAEAIDVAIKSAHVDRATEVERVIDEKREEWAEEQRSKVEDIFGMVEAP